jgi:hypothetical protein
VKAAPEIETWHKGSAAGLHARQFATFDRKLARQARRTTTLETISF